MRLFGGRNLGCSVERIEWNNIIDMFAYATQKGEVVIQRMNWEKFTTFPAPDKGVKVRSLNWQLDNLLLAVGYSNGQVSILDVGSETVFSGPIYEDDIKKVTFCGAIDCQESLGCHTFNSKDKHKQFLTDPCPLPTIDLSGMTQQQKAFPEGTPYFLMVVLCSGKVHLQLFGAVQAGSIDLTQYVEHPEQFEVYDVQMSSKFNAIYALLRDGQQLKMLHFRNQELQDFLPHILGVGRLCAHILDTKNYITTAEYCLMEAMEAVHLSLDNKLSQYASTQGYGTMAADFLELHILGFASFEVEDFLTMSERHLRRIAKSVENCFKDLHSLVFNNLKGATIKMFYFLNAITGLGRMPHFYESLVSPNGSVEALRACGSFFLKLHELQGRIDTMANEMVLFHKWLLFTIMRLSHQDIPKVMILSDEEDAALVEILNSMEPDSDDDDELGLFNLKPVAQYLQNEFLTQPHPVNPSHIWDEILYASNRMGLDTSDIIAPHDLNLSLVQQREKMFKAIEGILHRPSESISASFKLNSTIICHEFCTVEPNEDQHIVACNYYAQKDTNYDMFALTLDWQEAMILQFSRNDECALRCTRIHLMPHPFTYHIPEEFSNLRFLDLQFYNKSFLSILTWSLGTTTCTHLHSCLVQLSLSELENFCTEYDVSPLLYLPDASLSVSIYSISKATVFKCLEGECTMLAVSGGRKVVSVLSDAQHKLTIFEADLDKEESASTDTSLGSPLQISQDTPATNSDAEQPDT